MKVASMVFDAFGRSTADTLSGGAHGGARYDNSVTWFRAGERGGIRWIDDEVHV